jgi:hypothetical protein
VTDILVSAGVAGKYSECAADGFSMIESEKIFAVVGWDASDSQESCQKGSNAQGEP